MLGLTQCSVLNRAVVGQTRVTVESWTLKVVVLLLLLRHLVVVDLGDLTVRTGQA